MGPALSSCPISARTVEIILLQAKGNELHVCVCSFIGNYLKYHLTKNDWKGLTLNCSRNEESSPDFKRKTRARRPWRCCACDRTILSISKYALLRCQNSKS